MSSVQRVPRPTTGVCHFTLETMGCEDATDRLYKNKAILAPMVRAGTLPFRALALRYGADTVFTEEVIDRRVLNAVRTENSFLGSVDYVEARGKKGNAVPFQTCALERDRVVYQIGTSEAANALRAAQHVERDVAAFDINMGCPKRFSLQGGMGAALLKKPEVAADIVGTLRRNLSVPVSVKIRLLDSPSETVEFARRMEKAGACALTVHVRKVEDKPASKARWHELRPVVDAVNIPVVANGDVYTREDMADLKALSGCSSVMLARPALLNCSIFKQDGQTLPLKQVIQQYLRECLRYDSIYQNAKYTVMEMLTKRRHPDHLKSSISLGLRPDAPGMKEVTSAKNMQQLAVLWDLAADYDQEMTRRKLRAENLGGETMDGATQRSSIHRFDDEYFLQPQDNATGSSNTDHHPRGAHHDGGGGREADEAPAAEREGVGEINNAVTPDARRGGTEVLRRDNDDETITTSKEQMAEAKDLVSSERSTLESSLKGGVEGESTMVETAVTPGRGNGNTGNASHNGIDRNEHVDSELLPGARGDTRSERGDGVFLDGVASKSWVSSKRPRKEGDGQAP